MKIGFWRASGEIFAVLVIVQLSLAIVATATGAYGSTFGMLGGVAAAFFFIKLRSEPLSAFGFKSAGVMAILAGALGLFALMVPLFIFVEPRLEQIYGPIDFSMFAPLKGNTELYVLMLFVSWIGAAFGEEVVFRGFIMTRIAQMFSLSGAGWAIAIVVQAALFALAHAYQGPVGVIEIFVYSLAVGVVYIASGRSLWPVVLAHGLIDTFGMTDFYLGEALTEPLRVFQ